VRARDVVRVCSNSETGDETTGLITGVPPEKYTRNNKLIQPGKSGGSWSVLKKPKKKSIDSQNIVEL
jgi:hypothetical protein